MIAVDTNLLVYAHRAATPQHGDAQAALQRAVETGRGWGVALPCLAEFWMVVTHPSAARPSTPDEARGFLDLLRQDGEMRVFSPRRNLGLRLLNAAVGLGISGARIFDLQTGLIALEAGATELWTHDRSFVGPAGLRVVDPLGGE